MHSLFGVSKAAADLLVQEYGRYFGMPTVCFRAGCLSGPNHAGARLARVPLLPDALHASPASRTSSTATTRDRCRDNLHSADLVRAFSAFHEPPEVRGGLQHRRRPPQQLLDARGDRDVRGITGASLSWELSDEARIGDHRWWISDVQDFRRGLPGLAAGARCRGDSRGDLRAERRVVDGHGLRLSVVIPAHNEADSIGATLASLVDELERAEIEYEVLVVDDASADRTAALVAEFGSLASARPLHFVSSRPRFRPRRAGRPRALRG